MENASKALLIAGSVLLVILIIGIGMGIFDSVTGLTDQGKQTADTMTIQSFNGQFESAVGGSVKGSEVSALISKIQASNVNSANQVNADVTGDTNFTSQINKSHRYTVSVTKHAKNNCECTQNGNTENKETSPGFICMIRIDDNNN